MRTRKFAVFTGTVMPKLPRPLGKTEMAMAQTEVDARYRRVVARAPSGVDPLLRSLATKETPR